MRITRLKIEARNKMSKITRLAPMIISLFKRDLRVIAFGRTFSDKLCSSNSLYTNHSISDIILPLRLYSNESNTGNIVDYEYVHKATSSNNVLIVDVREPEEIKEHGGIPNSINIPLGNVSTILGNMSEKDFKKTYQRPKPTEDTEIIFYCMIGKRSGMAQENAAKLGFKKAKNYLGSWMEWKTKAQ